MAKVIVIVFCIFICSLLLKNYNNTFAVLVSVAGIILCFVLLGNGVKDFIQNITNIVSDVPTSVPYIKVMLKILCIVIIAQLMSQICKDNGENALASVTEISAKLIIISMIMPLFKTVISIMNGLVK